MVTVNEQTAAADVDFEVADFSGQFVERVRYPRDATVGEVVREMVSEMGIKSTDPSGVEYVFNAQREGRHLHAAERLGDVIESGQRMTLAPEISAGSKRADR